VRLIDRSVVVTGASGIAAATARLVAAEGGRVFVTSLDEAECLELVAEIESKGGTAAFRPADLRVESEAAEAFQSALEFMGRIDGLVAVAGASGRSVGDGPIHEIPLNGWEKTLQANLSPLFLATRHAVGSMLEGGGGSVVVVSSVLATSPVPDLFATHAYAAAKGAANSLVTSLASYYAASSIRVNGVAPGLVRTPMSARAQSDPATLEFVSRKQPLTGGLLEPDHVADVVLFLLSDESAQVTGQIVAVDGGWTVTAT
jgi:NAD(P)-dependent dehydrogenase (short-subunit alcohol dehydrogenase family)